MEARDTVYDTVIVGSGFGGALVAHELVRAGQRVLMLERGGWVARGPFNWHPQGSVDLTPYYSSEVPIRVLAGGAGPTMGSYSCVGGASVFYGGVSLRMRERDFEPAREVLDGSGAEWPWRYAELEPWYTRAEAILGIAGQAGEDPTEPWRSAPFPQPPGSLSETSRAIADAGRALGLLPFRLPLAINYDGQGGRASCQSCTTCDTFACAIGAKNDLATAVLPSLLASGLTLRHNTLAVRLVADGPRVTAVECVDKPTGQPLRFRGERFVLSAGALGTPHLLLASGLHAQNPAGDVVGRYLVRHCNAIVFGLFPGLPDRPARFHKQVGFHDFYFGHPTVKSPAGLLGGIQQLQSPPLGLVRAQAPVLGRLLAPAVSRLTGLLSMAQDQPLYDNHVTVDWARVDRFGLPQLTLTHHHTRRDLAARRALMDQSRRILKRAGALLFYEHEILTFSHAAGTVRMGRDASTSPLDRDCRFRGLDNLYVTDASCLPSGGGVNPSLTIAANALRVGHLMANGSRPA